MKTEREALLRKRNEFLWHEHHTDQDEILKLRIENEQIRQNNVSVSSMQILLDSKDDTIRKLNNEIYKLKARIG